MLKKLFRWECFGALFTIIAGSFLHFLYAWTGGSGFAAAIAPVNESTWEHLKLLFFPMILFSIVEYFVMGRSYPSFLPAKAVGLLSGMLLITTLFYTYSGIVGSNYLAIDILIFILAAVASAFLTWAFVAQHDEIKSRCVIASLIVLIVTTCCFILFTYYAPKIGLFLDPVTKHYGI